jgi:hypothetical protein
MTDRELLQQALDALELTGVEYLTSQEIEHLDALEIALRARLAQPEHEWVGMTNAEYESMAEQYVTNCYFDTLKYAKAIETKLKDKNYD